jgi:hypothetical protein
VATILLWLAAKLIFGLILATKASHLDRLGAHLSFDLSRHF